MKISLTRNNLIKLIIDYFKNVEGKSDVKVNFNSYIVDYHYDLEGCTQIKVLFNKEDIILNEDEIARIILYYLGNDDFYGIYNLKIITEFNGNIPYFDGIEFIIYKKEAKRKKYIK